jgi:hypothetical protein
MLNVQEDMSRPSVLVSRDTRVGEGPERGAAREPDSDVVTVSAIVGEGKEAHRLARVGAWAFTVWEALGDSEPRIRDVDAGARLGLGRARDIRKLIRRIWPGDKIREVFPRATVARGLFRGEKQAQQLVEEFWLTEAQLLKVCARAETPIADAILDDMIRVYIAVRRGLLVQPAADGAALCALQKDIAELRADVTALKRVVLPNAKFVEGASKPPDFAALASPEVPFRGWRAITQAVGRTLGARVSRRTAIRYAQPGRRNRLPVLQYDNGGVYLMPSALALWAAARSMPLGARLRNSG